MIKKIKDKNKHTTKLKTWSPTKDRDNPCLLRHNKGYFFSILSISILIIQQFL